MSDTKITPEETKTAVQLVEEMKKILDENGGKVDELKSDAKSRFEKLDADLEVFDKKNDELSKKFLAEQEANLALKADLDRLDKVVSRQAAQPESKDSYKQGPEFKALLSYVKGGKIEVSQEEKALLATDNNGQGGYLVGGPIILELQKQVEELSPVRQLARVRSIGGQKSINIPVRTSIPQGEYEGERETAQKKTSTYRSETMTAYRHHVITPVTRDLLNFADFNMFSEMQQDASEGFAVSEGRLFLTGTGDKQPEGILVNPDIQTITSAASLTIDVTETIQLLGNLKVGYNPFYFFNRATLVKLRTERDLSGGAGTGQFLWPDNAEGTPTTLNGIPYRIFQDMPDCTVANAKAVGLGDLARGYTIFDSTVVEVLRDDVTEASEAIINMHWYRYNTGQVTIPEAIKLIKVKA
jgi:HK97 family phage major capsid protein